MPCSAWCGTAEICLVEKQIVIHGSSSGPLGRIMPRSSPHAPLSPAAAASGARGSRRCWRAPPQWLEVVAIVSAVSAPSEPGQTQARLYLEHASTVLTSNKGFEEWGEIFGDEVMAAALIDRLVHHCHLVTIRGNSYRMWERSDRHPSASG